MKVRFPVAVIIAGISGMAAQIILLRELLILFHGNELSLGIIMANWLISQAAGTLLSGLKRKRSVREETFFILLQTFFSFIFPLSIIGIRIFPGIFHLVPGEALGPGGIFLASLAFLFPASAVQGALFTSGCRIAGPGDEPASSIGRVYVLFSVGNIAAGIFLTFALIPFFSSMTIALIMSFLVSMSSALLVVPGSLTLLLKKKTFLLLTALSLFFLVLAAGPASGKMHLFSLQQQWKGQKILSYGNSHFGNIAVTLMDGQTVFYENAKPLFQCPVPDIEAKEELAHIPLLFHPFPKDILVLNGGLGGLLDELIRYPMAKIDFTELDPLLIQTAKDFPVLPVRNELSSGKVTAYNTDSRRFLSECRRSYDAVFINISLPSELQTNRMLTREFLLQAKSHLNPGGLVTFSVPGSANYLSRELKALNSVIKATSESAFTSVRVMPGAPNIFIVSDSRLDKEEKELANTLTARNMPLKFLSPFHLSLRLDKDLNTWFHDEMKGVRQEINRDFFPIAVYYAQSYLDSIFHERKKNIFNAVSGLPQACILAAAAFFSLIFLFFRSFQSKTTYTRTASVYTLFTTGFVSMFFTMAVILAFQTLFGYVYYWISLLISSFMAGVSTGAFAASRRLKIIKSFRKHLTIVESLMILVITVFLLTIMTSNSSKCLYINIFISPPAFLLFNFLFGLLQGYEYPLSSRIYHEQDQRIEKTASRLYAADLIGGFAGGLAVTFFLIPLYGFLYAGLTAVILKAGNIAVLSLIRNDTK